MPLDPNLVKIIKKCQADPEFFISNFCKVKHPTAGVLPFKLFKYQKKCIKDFLKFRFNSFHKTRQSGISTLTGAFCLWYAMFFGYKTILIVSKTERDTLEFLDKNIRFVFDNLPDWMKELWKITEESQHKLGFSNGSSIKSLTSGKDVLRSNSSSLNIIDESAFMPDMSTMWSGGWPTLQHGGSVIIISTPNGTSGVGEWYYETWNDAVEGNNDFNPIDIHWWEMDWEISYKDSKSGNQVSICPTRGMRKNTSKEDIKKYGPYWSPWLEEQYRGLTKRGDDKLFRQEVLAEFIGSGSTILPSDVLQYINGCQDDTYQSVNMVKYINPVVGVPRDLDFQGRLWIWDRPIIDLNHPAKSHIYVAGVDTATGQAQDYSAIVVFDITTMTQVAELQMKCLPKIFAYMSDYIGRLYNNAMLVVERTGIGSTVVTELNDDLAYPNLYRGRRETSSLKKKFVHYGFNTQGASKQTLQRVILDYITEDGYRLKSSRLIKEFSALIDIGENKMKGKSGNHDDLALACSLALVGIDEYYSNSDRGNMVPLNTDIVKYNTDSLDADFRHYMEVGGKNTLMPIITTTSLDHTKTPEEEIENFSRQIGGISVDKNNINIVAQQKYIIDHKRKSKNK